MRHRIHLGGGHLPGRLAGTRTLTLALTLTLRSGHLAGRLASTPRPRALLPPITQEAVGGASPGHPVGSPGSSALPGEGSLRTLSESLAMLNVLSEHVSKVSAESLSTLTPALTPNP